MSTQNVVPKPKRYGIRDLIDDLGYASFAEMIVAEAGGGCCPAICVKCGWTTHMEPDQDRGWCESCDKGGRVKSALILAGMI